VILFELLTGKQLVQGETVSDTLAAVLRAEPDWQALPVGTATVTCCWTTSGRTGASS
jgi:hypothetical protein